ncbi:MAG: amidohydrolase family protein [Pirellulales bacterium]|nr:amidohydrolase family protein [Pirellulales bacterium]
MIRQNALTRQTLGLAAPMHRRIPENMINMAAKLSTIELEPSGVARSVDREFFERELATFLPDKIFDAHCHVWIDNEVTFKVPGFQGSVGSTEYFRLMNDLHPDRVAAALLISFAMGDRPESADRMNAWVAEQTAQRPNLFGEFFVRPTDDPEWVRNEVQRLGLHGLKCYHWFAAKKPTWEARIPEYLPEQLVKVAHEEGWVITLHVVRSRACADQDNLYWVRRYCEQYPNMRLILAHSARGFQPAHNLAGLAELQGLDNLYFDTSVNCEPLAHQVILRLFGPKKLLYGTDLPISHLRGRSVGIADSFMFLDEAMPIWKVNHTAIEPVLLGLESLRAIKWACWAEKLGDRAVEDIFWNNAAELFGL